MNTEATPQNQQNAEPQQPRNPIKSFPEPAGYALKWDGEALGLPPTGMNLMPPKSKTEKKGQ